MSELEQLLVLFVAAVILAAAARRAGAPYPVFLAHRRCSCWRSCRAAPSFTLPPELALALFVAPVLLDAAYDASLQRSQRQLGAGHGSRRLRGRIDHRRRGGRRPRARAGDAVGGGDCARRRRRSTRRRRRDRRASPAATAASPPDDPRRREPAERRECAPDLSPGRRRGRGGRLLHRRSGADLPARRGWQHRRRAGARVASRCG